jgi:formiminoglutamase
LPDFNIGTNNGTTCAPGIEKAVADICAAARGHSSILNGRFKGGWTTRHYGRPHQNWHAIQMELAQSTYLEAEAAPWNYDEIKAQKLRLHLQRILETARDIAFQIGKRT